MAQAQGRYGSAVYKEIRPLRIHHTDGDVVLVW